MPTTIPYIDRNERDALHAFRYAQHSDNPYCMGLLIDFIEMEFGLLPVQSPGESVTFLPPFVAFVGAALWDTSIWVSLFGQQYQFDGKDTVLGQNPNWRKFNVRNRSEDITRAKNLIQQACENYKRSQAHLGWDEIVQAAEQRWLDNRNRELQQAAYQKRLRQLLDDL
jgi:hypothetical protein